MKIFSSKKRVAAIGVVTAATLVGGGMAFAYWTSTGSGPGTATTGTSSEFEVVVESNDTTVVPLAPGHGTQTFSVTVTNPGSGVQRLNSVDVTVADRDGTSGAALVWDPPGACSAVDYTVSPVEPVDPADFGDDLAPGASWTGTFSVAMNETGVPQDSCKDLPVPLHAAAS